MSAIGRVAAAALRSRERVRSRKAFRTVLFRLTAVIQRMASLAALTRSERANAGIGWLFTGVVGLAAVGSFLWGSLLWAGFALLVAAVVAVPPLLTGDWRAMVPWPLILVAAAAVSVRAAGTYPDVSGFVAISALALVAVAELDAFTEVEMSRRFAVVFAVMTTLAAQALWIVAQYASDQWLDTTFLTTQRELQVDIVAVTCVAAVMGAVFEWYFRRVEHAGSKHGPVVPSGER